MHTHKHVWAYLAPGRPASAPVVRFPRRFMSPRGPAPHRTSLALRRWRGDGGCPAAAGEEETPRRYSRKQRGEMHHLIYFATSRCNTCNIRPKADETLETCI
jgi:hypothetical protein